VAARGIVSGWPAARAAPIVPAGIVAAGDVPAVVVGAAVVAGALVAGAVVAVVGPVLDDGAALVVGLLLPGPAAVVVGPAVVALVVGEVAGVVGAVLVVGCGRRPRVVVGEPGDDVVLRGGRGRRRSAADAASIERVEVPTTRAATGCTPAASTRATVAIPNNRAGAGERTSGSLSSAQTGALRTGEVTLGPTPTRRGWPNLYDRVSEISMLVRASSWIEK
jgi:hypothetical protein